MSNDELTDVVANMDDYVLKSCLEHLSESDLADILKRTDNLSGQVAAFQLDDKGNTKKSEIFDNRYEYLFSDEFSDYCISAGTSTSVSGSSSDNLLGFCSDGYTFTYMGKTLLCEVSGGGTKTATVTLTSSDSSVFSFDTKTKIASASSTQVDVNGIKTFKDAHSKLVRNSHSKGIDINASDTLEKNSCKSTTARFGVNLVYDATNHPTASLKCSSKLDRANATCTKPATCAICGVIEEAKGHLWGNVYTYTGNHTHYRTCERCSINETPKNCNRETDVAATCIAGGYTNCSVCGGNQATTQALGHSWDGWSWSDDSQHVRTCTRCSTPDYAQHTPYTVNGVDVVWYNGADIGADIDKHFAKCNVCGSYYSGCSHVMEPYTNASCEGDGSEKCHWCSRIGKVSKLGHTNDHFSWTTSTLSGTGAKFSSTYNSSAPSVETGNYTLSDGNKVHIVTEDADTGRGVTVPNGQRFTQCTRNNCDDTTNHHQTAYQYAVIPAVASSPTANKAISSVSKAVYGSQGGKVKVTATPKTGYHFTEWYTDADCHTIANVNTAGEISVGSNPIQLYADGEINKSMLHVIIPTPGSSTVEWEQPTTTSTASWFHSGTAHYCEAAYGTNITFSNPTAVGYDFAGWNISSGADGNVTCDRDAGTSSFTFGPGNNTTTEITAIWKPRTDTKLSIDVYTQDLYYGTWTSSTKIDTFVYKGTTDTSVGMKDLADYVFTKEQLSSDIYYHNYDNSETAIIKADGRTRIEIHYARIKHTVKINGASSKLKADISLSSQTKQTVPSSSSGDVTTWTVYAGDTCTVTITPYTSERERYDHYIERVKRIESVNGAAVSYSLTGVNLAPYVQDDGAFVYQMSDIIKDMQFDYEIYGRPEIRISSRLSSNAKASPWTADVMYTITGTTNLGNKVTYSKIISGETETALTVDPGMYLIYAETAYRWNITTDAGTAVELDVSDGAEVSDAGGHKDAVFDVDVKDWSKFSDSATYILDLK